jgi:hypothetical protein
MAPIPAIRRLMDLLAEDVPHDRKGAARVERSGELVLHDDLGGRIFVVDAFLEGDRRQPYVLDQREDRPLEDVVRGGKGVDFDGPLGIRVTLLEHPVLLL